MPWATGFQPWDGLPMKGRVQGMDHVMNLITQDDYFLDLKCFFIFNSKFWTQNLTIISPLSSHWDVLVLYPDSFLVKSGCLHSHCIHGSEQKDCFSFTPPQIQHRKTLRMQWSCWLQKEENQMAWVFCCSLLN